MFFDHHEILFYIGDFFLNNVDLIQLSTVSKNFYKSTQRSKFGYIGQNIISKLGIESHEIHIFFDYLRKNSHDFEFQYLFKYNNLLSQLNQGYSETSYHITNQLIKIILDSFFFSEKSPLISVKEKSKTCLETGIISRVRFNDIDYCRKILNRKHQLFRCRFKNLFRELTIREKKIREEHLRRNFRNCYAIII